MELFKIIYVCILLGICVVTDLQEKKVKNCCVLMILGGAVVFLILKWNGQAVIESLWIIIIFFMVLFPVFVIGALGAGDVKLLSVTAFYIGKEGEEFFLAGTLICGGLLSLVKLMYHGLFLKGCNIFLHI